MSRIGKKTIHIPQGVSITLVDRLVTVKGPKGTLNMELHPTMGLKIENEEAHVEKIKADKNISAFWGLTRALIQNMVLGVTEGYQKKLELQGVGYRMNIQGKKINLALGFSHPVVVDIPEGLEAKIEENNVLSITGIDKQSVGQFAAEIRSLKKVEPYKGKGFRYVGEHVRRKAGKKATASK